ncbi:MAG: hypothetical protein PHU06_13945 [Gallionella sp.]|nr:hypothetical protein [Gallionella sp.]MDD4960151.1 hypothetical protein [Gallionella sp.]
MNQRKGGSPSTSFSPDKRAIITAPHASLKTLTAVRHISKMRSTAKIKPIASTGRPMDAKIMAMATQARRRDRRHTDGCHQRHQHDGELLHKAQFDAAGWVLLCHS